MLKHGLTSACSKKICRPRQRGRVRVMVRDPGIYVAIDRMRVGRFDHGLVVINTVRLATPAHHPPELNRIDPRAATQIKDALADLECHRLKALLLDRRKWCWGQPRLFGILKNFAYTHVSVSGSIADAINVANAVKDLADGARRLSHLLISVGIVQLSQQRDAA